jgi:signal-transduction protein with cAMP-binding, CBS, and nucleotidyltransferase domain
MEALRFFLKQIVPFDDLELNESLSFFKQVKIDKDQYYVSEDEVCKKVVFIKTGLFRLFYTVNGVEKIMLFFQENQFLTDYYGFLTQTPSKRPIQAIEDSIVYNISYDDFQLLFNSSKKWERVGRIMAERAYVYSVQRANRIIHDDPDTRFITFLKEFPTLIQRVPQYMIASFLNMTPETYSRVKRRVNLKDIESFTSIHDPIQKN